MTNMINPENVRAHMQSLYIYDRLTRAGFPLTDDIMCVDMSELSQEERLAVAANQLDDVIEKHGQTLMSQMTLATRILGFVLKEVNSGQPKHVQDQILESVKSALSKIIDGSFDEASE